MYYKTSPDNLTKSITIAVTILFVSISVSQFVFMHDELPLFVPVIVTLLLLLIYIGTYVFSPREYRLDEEGLTIHRFFSNVLIAKDSLKSVERATKENMKWAIRTFGVGGLFGYYGKFVNRKYGSMTFYATQRSNFVLITTTDNQKIVLTPDEPDKLIAECNSLYELPQEYSIKERIN